jgi:putative ABC transport system ATP-binding protein
MLADEPTGNLDSRTGDEIMELFSALNREGRTIVVVTHEPDIAVKCPRCIRIHDGKVLSDGPSAAVAAAYAARS